jgi:hypothetical protein
MCIIRINAKLEDKGKVSPIPWRHMVEWRIVAHTLTLALGGGEWSTSPPGKEPPLPIGYKAFLA